VLSDLPNLVARLSRHSHIRLLQIEKTFDSPAGRRRHFQLVASGRSARPPLQRLGTRFGDVGLTSGTRRAEKSPPASLPKHGSCSSTLL
jgi:hypothetical protein